MYTAGQNVRFTDNTTQAANMMLGLRVIGPSTPCRLAIRHMSNERIHNTYERDCGSFRNHPMRVVGGLDVPHTLVRDGAVFGLRGSCRVGRVQRYVEGIFSEPRPGMGSFRRAHKELGGIPEHYKEEV